jgi:hypothetical protein
MAPSGRGGHKPRSRPAKPSGAPKKAANTLNFKPVLLLGEEDFNDPKQFQQNLTKAIPAWYKDFLDWKQVPYDGPTVLDDKSARQKAGIFQQWKQTNPPGVHVMFTFDSCMSGIGPLSQYANFESTLHASTFTDNVVPHIHQRFLKLLAEKMSNTAAKPLLSEFQEASV